MSKQEKWREFKWHIDKLARFIFERLFECEDDDDTGLAKSASLVFENAQGDTHMDVTVHLNDKPLTAVLVEFDGPNGTGNQVPSIGPDTYLSSDPTVATVDPASGNLAYIKAGVTTITGLNSGNGLTAAGVLTIISGLAQSAVLNFVTPGAVPSPLPTIASVSPASGPAGTVVTITGANLGATQGASTVTFNGTASTPTSWSDTSIVVPVPQGATSGHIVVTVVGQSLTMTFTVA